MTTAPRISVVICAYTEDRWNDLVAAVESVHLQTVPPLEILVVVDHNQQLLERARAHLDGVRICQNLEPQGLSGARNSGIAAAEGDVIAFLDEDAAAASDWLEQLGQPYHDPLVLGVGGAIDPAWLDGRPGWFPEEFDWVVGCTYRGMRETPGSVRNLIGCNMSFRKAAFEQVGGFRNGIGRVGTRPLGCEETEFCIRVSRSFPRAVLLYTPRARVSHRVPRRRGQWRYFRARCYGEGYSKAIIARLVGAGDGLASERTYVVRTLPTGMLRGIIRTLQGGGLAGILQAGAMAAGLAYTVTGYLVGMLVLRLSPRVQINAAANALGGQTT